MKLFVEGGGDHNRALAAECRQAFSEFFKRAGINRRPRVVACGGRELAFHDFRVAVEQHEDALLLVDSESPVAPEHCLGEETTWQPWSHLADRDGWRRPTAAQGVQCHLMVQCMESWLLTDAGALRKLFGPKFNAARLPPPAQIEAMSTDQALRALKTATQGCNRSYDKGQHSFKLLLGVDPALVAAASPWARRLLDQLRNA